MAYLLAVASGNFTSSSTWGVVDTTSRLDSEISTVALGTSNTDTQTFTPGAINVIGAAIKLQSRAASPTGTLTLTLRNSTDAADVTSVTINVSDIHVNGNGIIFLKFGATQTLIAGKAYILRAVTSSNSQVTLYRGATAADFCRWLVTDTTAAPASGDWMCVVGAKTAAATFTTYTVTMDNTAATSFGPTVSGGPPQGMIVGDKGVLDWATAASTAYKLTIKGIFLVAGGGTVNIGTSGTPIPSTSSNELIFDIASTNDSGLVIDGGTFNHYGPTKKTWTTMTADTAASATTVNVADITGWETSDVVAFAPVTNSSNDYFTKVINTLPGGNSFTVTVAITNALTNVTVFPVEVLNTTQRCKIRGTSSSLNAYIIVKNSGSATIKQAEIYWMGGGTANKQGIDLQQVTTSAGVTIESCSLHDFSQNGYLLNLGNTSNYGYTTTFKNNSCYLCWFGINAQRNAHVSSLSIEGNCFTAFGQSIITVELTSANYPAKILNNHITHAYQNTVYGMYLQINNNVNSTPTVLWGYENVANYSGNVLHSCNTVACYVQTLGGLSFNATWQSVSNFAIKGWKFYCNNNPSAAGALRFEGITLDSPVLEDCEFFGNYAGIYITGVPYTAILNGRLYGCSFGSGSTRTSNTQTYGMYFLAFGVNQWYLENCTFGTTATGKSAHSSSDLGSQSDYFAGCFQITGSNCKLDSTNQVWTVASSEARAQSGRDTNYIRMNRLGQTSNSHKSWYKYGIEEADSTIYDTAAPSTKLTPNSASYKFESSSITCTVPSGGSRTINVKVRKSQAGDGAAYNGNQPRLIVKRNYEAGITADTVLATYASGAGSFNTMTGTVGPVSDNCVLEFVLDCDGTTGWVNFDTISFS